MLVNSGGRRFALALALLALIALASTSRLEGGDNLSASQPGIILLAVGGVVLVTAIAASGVFGSWYAAFVSARRATKLVTATVALLLVTAFIALFLYSPSPHTPLKCREPCPTKGVGPRGWAGENGGGSRGSSVGAVVAGGALLAALLVLVGAMVAAERRRRRALAMPQFDEAEAVLQAVDESLDDLRRERDVRRAIIACYARMERALERAGSARRPAEAPFEYLVRILERVTGSSRAARALTELFERAKFSVEPMGERDKQQAIGSLELLRAEVGQAS